MAPTSEKSERLSLNERINNFVQKNRSGVTAGIVIFAVVLLGTIAFLIIRDFVYSKAISRVEELYGRYEALRLDINEPSKEAEVQTLLEDLKNFAEKNSGYPGARSYFLIADIHADKKDWAEAEKAWISAAKAGTKSYLAPVSLFRAAAAAEEQGNIAGAIDLYTKSVSLESQFPSAPRAQFSIGRLREAQNNIEAALEAYRTLVSKWPADAFWANMAQSRIVLLGN
jgi:tetratricopeptide (TPR) repeat protein